MKLSLFARAVVTGARLICPRCSQGCVFAGWFKMQTTCTRCNFRFEREQGYYVGAMYINYGITVIIAFSGYFALDHFTPIPSAQNLLLWGVFSVLFPVFFFRQSRCLWLSFDYLFNTPEARETPIHTEGRPKADR